MARQIRLDQIGDYVEGRMDQLLRVTVLETDKRLKSASPVDTGRFRASWQVGENAATGGQVGPGSYSSAPALTRIGYSQEKVGNIYSVHNNLPYAEPLATGVPHGSKQASPGWVQGIAKDMQTFVVNNAAKIGRES
jgi:hypothetical protein